MPNKPRKPPSKPETYASLKKKWYQKLKDEGFKDVELSNGSLADWSNWLVKHHTLEQMQAKQSYYQMVDRFLDEYHFEDQLEQIIWEYHANGLSTREISQVLDKVTTKPHSYVTVHRIIVYLEDRMKRLYMTPQGNEDEH